MKIRNSIKNMISPRPSIQQVSDRSQQEDEKEQNQKDKQIIKQKNVIRLLMEENQNVKEKYKIEFEAHWKLKRQFEDIMKQREVVKNNYEEILKQKDRDVEQLSLERDALKELIQELYDKVESGAQLDIRVIQHKEEMEVKIKEMESRVEEIHQDKEIQVQEIKEDLESKQKQHEISFRESLKKDFQNQIKNEQQTITQIQAMKNQHDMKVKHLQLRIKTLQRKISDMQQDKLIEMGEVREAENIEAKNMRQEIIRLQKEDHIRGSESEQNQKQMLILNIEKQKLEKEILLEKCTTRMIPISEVVKIKGIMKKQKPKPRFQMRNQPSHTTMSLNRHATMYHKNPTLPQLNYFPDKNSLSLSTKMPKESHSAYKTFQNSSSKTKYIKSQSPQIPAVQNQTFYHTKVTEYDDDKFFQKMAQKTNAFQKRHFSTDHKKIAGGWN